MILSFLHRWKELWKQHLQTIQKSEMNAGDLDRPQRITRATGSHHRRWKRTTDCSIW
jgi:DNA-binding PadR family transcriptional regulator